MDTVTVLFYFIPLLSSVLVKEGYTKYPNATYYQKLIVTYIRYNFHKMDIRI